VFAQMRRLASVGCLGCLGRDRQTAGFRFQAPEMTATAQMTVRVDLKVADLHAGTERAPKDLALVNATCRRCLCPEKRR
jgi:hypothetical protein